MFEGKKVKSDNKGRVSYNRNILNSIVTLAASEIAGVQPFDNDAKRPARFSKIDFVDDKDVYVEVYVRIKHGYSVPDVASKIQENIKNSIETMTAYKAKAVNLHVVGVVFEETQRS